MLKFERLVGSSRNLNHRMQHQNGFISKRYFCALNTNLNKRHFSENGDFPPSYKFNEKETNPTTLRGLFYQLFYPSREGSSNNDGVGQTSEKSRLQQIFSIFKNPGLHESLYRLKQKTIPISKATDPTNRYDYVVVGAGSAGCALAYRLATSHMSSQRGRNLERKKVLLIEAGPKDTNPWIHIPVGYFKTLHNPRISWGYNIEEETSGLDGRGIAWPRAKVLGGCSSVNGLLWVRGIPQDYNNWDEMSGNHGIWTWNKVKESFKRMEGHIALKPGPISLEGHKHDVETFGADGPITISNTRYKTGLCNAFIHACEKELKLIKQKSEKINIIQEENESEDMGFNSGVVGYFQLTTNYGFRSSTAVGYLNKANRLADEISLDVLTGYEVDRILFDENKVGSSNSSDNQKYGAIGVEVSEHQNTHSQVRRFLNDKVKFLNENSNSAKKYNILLNSKGMPSFKLVLAMTYYII